jgi:uncharacterized protein
MWFFYYCANLFLCYNFVVEIVWDDIKRRTNLHKHGFDFADLDMEFFAQATIYPAKLGRVAAVGLFSELWITVIFAQLGSEAISIVSMRDASVKERKMT